MRFISQRVLILVVVIIRPVKYMIDYFKARCRCGCMPEELRVRCRRAHSHSAVCPAWRYWLHSNSDPTLSKTS
jgi:hypothetical protein